MGKTVSFKLNEKEQIALAYFRKTDVRNSNPDVFRAVLMKAYNKLPKDRQSKHEEEYREEKKSE